MERFIRPIDTGDPEHEMLLHQPRASQPISVTTPDKIKARRQAHNLWVATTAISSIFVFLFLFYPSIIGGINAQQTAAQVAAVTDGRVVRVEDKLERLQQDVSLLAADYKILSSDNQVLKGEISGISTMVKFMGSVIVVLAAAATYLTRKSR